ncbi:hypothetical protein ACFFWD_01675 [Bradyrhizobium erythrophlei]|uniref:hypothetical protein n=1 Tax=Bradyrhizobium erythrophlei TaxID=1437360 RepID=UPI0035EB0624
MSTTDSGFGALVPAASLTMTIDTRPSPWQFDRWNRLKGAVLATVWGRAAPVEACLMHAR